MRQSSLLGPELSPWMVGTGIEGDIVLSSRIRLARNLALVPFPNRADHRQLAEVVEKLKVAEADLSDHSFCYEFFNLEEITALDRYMLVEKHILSPAHVQEPLLRAFIAREDGAVSIMINEEDHLRIQALARGLDLAGVLENANWVDDKLEAKCEMAFSESLGYLTACPTNLGTGLRASVMVHLPALALTKQLNRLVTAATQLGLTVRGLYGEGSESAGNIFQISNQLTLGHNEREIIDALKAMVTRVVEQERTARQYLLRFSEDSIADSVWRAYGMLRYARSISDQEALTMISQVWLGVDMEIIKEVSANIFHELIVTTRPNYIQKFFCPDNAEPRHHDRIRASIIRDKLQGG